MTAGWGCGNRAPIEEMLPAPGRNLNRAGLEQYHRGNLVEAEELFVRARIESEAIDDLEAAAHATYNLSLVYRDRGDFDAALQAVSECEAVFRRLESSDGLARALAVQGSVLALQERERDALAAYREALADASDEVRAEILVNRSLILFRQGKIDEAGEAAGEAISLAADDMVRADALFSLARVQLRRNELREAYRALLEVADLDRSARRLRSLAGTLNLLAEVATGLGMENEARDFHRRALGVYAALGVDRDREAPRTARAGS